MVRDQGGDDFYHHYDFAMFFLLYDFIKNERVKKKKQKEKAKKEQEKFREINL